MPDSLTGIVVASIDTCEYSEGFAEADWGYLKTGILVDTKQAGLVHYPAPPDGPILKA